ncbi:MAG: nucleotidyltransferase family protein [Methylococcales bacterium]|nr:MAG: nucleotidyltransferase family protein [Methylococcales bacterium]
MKAMILAAGRGERMRPLTDHTPKPLLQVSGQALIEHTINQLVSAGFTDIVINHAHLGQQIVDYLGDGQRYGANIHYSAEGELGLETAGGIINALPLLGEGVFLVVNADIATDFSYAQLRELAIDLAHLVLIDNPVHHPQGDFGLDDLGQVCELSSKQLTFSGIGLYHTDLFKDLAGGSRKLGLLLRTAISSGQVTGQYYSGFWMDIGTPERLQALEALDWPRNKFGSM